MTERKFISYLRVSTDKQGKSGLGIEAQRQAVERYLNGGRWTVAAEYVETESGRRSDRPKLAAALAHAKALKAKLVFAKLDRLTRNSVVEVPALELAVSGEPGKIAGGENGSRSAQPRDILVVDDEADIRNVLEQAITDAEVQQGLL